MPTPLIGHVVQTGCDQAGRIEDVPEGAQD
jgi:hypothetical protein